MPWECESDVLWLTGSLLKSTANPQLSMLREGTRGTDHQQNRVFSYLSAEVGLRRDHPLRAIRAMVDVVLTQLSPRFNSMYADLGRPSIPPE
jgi:hypothetical protein